MSPVISCPSAEQLESILRGQAPPETVESFVAHLEHCEHCSAAVEKSLADNTLLEAIQLQATVPNAPAGYVLALIQRLVRLPVDESVGETGGRTTAGGLPPSPAALLSDFLSPPQAADELGRLGQYRVLKLLGKGGMGVVFQAEDARLKRMVALKVIRPEVAGTSGNRERFLREAQAAAKLEHENIVTIYQVDEANGVSFLAMQWLKGMTLEDHLRQGSALSAPQIVRLGKQIAGGLAAAHDAGLVHRDIKPANLWIEPAGGGRIKILDFGLARVESSDVGLTQSGTIVGTPSYMSPEQGRSEKASPRSDLFSLGVVLYLMCTRQLPFRGENTMALLTALAVDEPAPAGQLNPALPPRLAELVMQLLAKHPDRRPASAHEVAERLEAIERQLAEPGEPSQTEVMPIPEQQKTPARQAPWKRIGLAAAVALAVLLPVGYYFGGTVLQVATNKGVLVVKVDDPDVAIVVKQHGVVVQNKTTKREFVLTAADGEVEVYEKDSGLKLATKKFTLTRGGKEYVSVVVTRPAPAVVRPGKAGEKKPPVMAGDERAVAKWVLSLGGRVRVRVAGREQDFASVKDLPAEAFQVIGVYLTGTKVSDAEVVHLKGLPNLTGLNLSHTQVSDTGLAHLKGLTRLMRLELHAVQVSDAGLAHLKGLTRLQVLALSGHGVSDAGLAYLKGHTNLTLLYLYNTQVSDAGVALLKGFTRLTQLGLSSPRVSDAGLANLKELPNLKGLGLGCTKVSDAGLAHLKGLTSLTHLSLYNTPVSDTGLAHIKALRNLLELGLNGSRVSDAGLVHLKGLTNLMNLDLQCPQVSDVGLAHLKGLANLKALNLVGTKVSDAGLAHLEGLTKLTILYLSATQVSDAGLTFLKALPNLEGLRLAGTRVSDAGIGHFLSLKRLESLDLNNTRVSLKGITDLREALPRVAITWAERNRSAAEAVLALGSTVQFSGKGQVVKTAAELPSGYFRVSRISLAGVKKPLGDLCFKLALLTDPEWDALQGFDLAGSSFGDNDLKSLNALTRLTELSLSGTQVSDAGLPSLDGWTGLQRLVLDGLPITGIGLAPLTDLPRLTDLSLARTKVSDASLASLKGLKKLRRLVLDGTALRGPGLANLKDLTELTELRLGCATLTDVAGPQLGELKALKRLERLSLAGSRIGDETLKQLHGLTTLRELDLTGTKVSAAGIAAAKKALPMCRIIGEPAKR
jgi:Leucine-rich repeat (LRR) protein